MNDGGVDYSTAIGGCAHLPHEVSGHSWVDHPKSSTAA